MHYHVQNSIEVHFLENILAFQALDLIACYLKSCDERDSSFAVKSLCDVRKLFSVLFNIIISRNSVNPSATTLSNNVITSHGLALFGI